MARKPTGNPNGRPPAKIDRRQFEAMCHIFCTKEEICALFDVDDSTLSRWCKREYGESFAEVYRKKREGGKMSLRRSAIKQAERSAATMIFLLKNYCGMKDEQTHEVRGAVQIINDIPRTEDPEDGDKTD